MSPQTGSSNPATASTPETSALDDADGVLRTFNAVLAIARLEAEGVAVKREGAALAGDFRDLESAACQSNRNAS